MPDPERIRAAATLRKPPSEPPPENNRLERSPAEELRRLTVSAESENARVNALRLLLDRMDVQRQHHAEKAAAEAEQKAREDLPAPSLTDDWTPQRYAREWDQWTAADASAVLYALFNIEANPPPPGNRPVDEDFARHSKAASEQLLEDHPRLAAVIHHGIEERAKQRAEIKEIEAEIEHRAQDKAEDMYRSRSFRAVQAEDRTGAVSRPESSSVHDRTRAGA